MLAAERKLLPKPVRWVLLGIYALLVATVMWLGFANAVGNVSRNKNPELALQMDADNPVALTVKGDLILQSGPASDSLGQIKRLALRSVARQAINPAGLRLLGFVDALEGRNSKAEKLMNLSSRLSRRELGTRLWLIETAVDKENVTEALTHYDIALRSNIDSYQILLPTLTDALVDPEVRRGMWKFVNSPPPWMPSFLDVAISTSAHPEDIAKTLIGGGGLPEYPPYKGFSDRLAEQLIAKHQYGAFRDYYRSLKGGDPSALTNPSFIISNIDPIVTAAGWQLSSNTNVNAAFNANKGKYDLSVFVGSGNREMAARKLLFLSPGDYNFVAVFNATEENRGAQASWQMHCLRADNKVSLWTATGDIVRGRRTTRQSFNVSHDCPSQSLEMTAIGTNGQNGTDFVVESISIVKD